MPRWFWLTTLCLLALALSSAYVSYYLRGGPRIIDATSYFLEARSLAAGSFSFHVPEPTAAFRGRFLLASGDGQELGVIFPPGYPLVLSAGMRLGVPLLVGPVLGALLVAATYALARALEQDGTVALLAAALSTLCAALRYHTADTMSHGLATLLACLVLTFALRRERPFFPLLAGLCWGLLLATRPVSAGVSLLLAGFTLRGRSMQVWLSLLLGAVPGAALLVSQQHALTGNYLSSTQLAYYAVSDAPPGCFRYGFGQGIGCRFEHGDFVTRFLPNGYTFGPALRNLGGHLLAFATDATNIAPLTLLSGYGLVRHFRSPLVVLGAGVLLQALAYVPFYFDGNYPGGGARFLCEAIPLCQILVARAACDLGMARFTPALAILGFAFHAREGHERLRDRQGGRPMYEPEVLERAGVKRGLVLVGTDHGFNLGFDPRARDAATSVVVAREHDDAHDRELYERLGRPPTYRYVYDLSGRFAPHLLPHTPRVTPRGEAEAEWPALVERSGAYPIHYPCASAGRALRLHPGAPASFQPPRGPQGSELLLGWVGTTGAGADIRVSWGSGGTSQAHRFGPGCSVWRTAGRPASLPSARLVIELERGEGALDFIETAEAGGAPPPRGP